MGSAVFVGRAIAGCILFSIITLNAGCQVAPVVSTRSLNERQLLVNFDGLKPAEILQELRVSWAVPDNWRSLPLKKTILYTHQQWRSPTRSTGVGVAHIQLPLAIPAQSVLWLAKAEYLRRATSEEQNGRLIGEWTDSLGRQWFEAENSKYHVRGYAITQGSEAWIVYSGWRVATERQPTEIAIASRSIESVVPSE